MGRHLYIVEFAEAAPGEQALRTFADVLDDARSAANEDYHTHRAGGYGLRSPRVHAVPPGSFAAWMKSRGQLGGQHKVPRIITDPELLLGFREFTGSG